jgi:hypothetical protein
VCAKPVQPSTRLAPSEVVVVLLGAQSQLMVWRGVACPGGMSGGVVVVGDIDLVRVFRPCWSAGLLVAVVLIRRGVVFGL